MANSFWEHMRQPSCDVLERERRKALCKITRQDGAVGWGCLIYEPKVQNPYWSEYFIITSCRLIPKENFDAEKYHVEFSKPNSKSKCFQLGSIIKKSPFYNTSGLVVIFVDSECSELNHDRFRRKHCSILKDLEPKIGLKESKPLFCYIESNRYKYTDGKLVPENDDSHLPSPAECCSTVLLEQGERNSKAVGVLNFEVNEQQLICDPVWFKKSRVEDILGLPDKPTIQKEEGEVDVEFTLTWSASNTNCTDVSPKYRLEWRKKLLTGASKLCQQENTDETHFKITNLEYNSEYEVKLFAFNRHGESEPEVSTFKTKTGLPEKPTITNTESEVDNDFTMTWSEVEANSSNGCIKYRLEWRKQSMTGSTELVQQGNIVETQYKIIGLEYGTEYEMKLFAVNRQGESEPDVRTFKTKSGLPEKPIITTVESEVDIDFTVTWSEVEANSSNCSIKYRLEWTKQPMTQFTVLVQRGNIVETHYKITGLEYDAEYEMKLFAVNKQGDSEPDVRTFKTKSGLPEKPTITNVESEVDKDFTVTWSEVEANSSNYSIKYRLEWMKQPMTQSTELVQRGNIVETHYEITGLEYDAEYEVKLFAVNRQGESEPDVRKFKTKSGLPDKPTIQKEEGEVDVEFTLTWSASNTNCTDISPKYRLEWRKKPLTGASKLCQQGNTDETHFKITNLECNSEYEVKLFAFNRHGESEPEVSTFKTKTGLPGKPAITNVESEADKDFTVTWSEVEANSSNCSIKYRLECIKQPRTQSTELVQRGNIMETHYEITGLEYDAEYEVKLFAVNKEGDSEPDIRTFKTKSGVPEKPIITNAEGEVDIDFTVTWSEVEANSSNCSIKYRLEWTKQPMTQSTQLVQRGNIVKTHYEITGLEYDAEYEVKLFAVNKQGDSEPDVRTFRTKSGLFTAASVFKTEWRVVEGIKDFIGKEQSSKKWKEFACVMAASVVAHNLRDPIIFQEWPHCNSDESALTADSTNSSCLIS